MQEQVAVEELLVEEWQLLVLLVPFILTIEIQIEWVPEWQPLVQEL
jgi:hypothetical protein